MLSIIVAVASNWAIGKENNLLWHISEDLKFFKRTTLGYPIIMGYNTFLSLGSKALPKRRNIVINRNV
jgi:dihydrofolate reductase